METKALLEIVLEIADAFKGEDIKTMHVTERCSFTDYFVLVTGSSSLTIQAMAEEMIFRCKHADRPPLHVEGLTSGEWVLLDFGDVIVHLFTQERREYFNLESLWTHERPLLSEDASESKDNSE